MRIDAGRHVGDPAFVEAEREQGGAVPRAVDQHSVAARQGPEPLPQGTRRDVDAALRRAHDAQIGSA